MDSAYTFDHEFERHAMCPRKFLGEVENTDNLVGVVCFKLFPRNFL